MKTAAWLHRHAARDLYDLWALARAGAGAVDAAAAGAFEIGVGWWPRSGDLFDRAPADDWHAALAHQAADLPPVDEALRVVRAAFASLDRG